MVCILNAVLTVFAGCVTFAVLGFLAYEINESDMSKVLMQMEGLLLLLYITSTCLQLLLLHLCSF